MSKKVIVLSMFLIASLVFLAACSRPSNVREFFESNAAEFQELVDEVNAEVASMSAALGIDLSVNLEIQGDDTIIYNFIYGPDTHFEPSAEADLAQAIDGMADFQTETAQGLRRSMGIDTLYITMRYLDSNGRVLAEGTFAGH